MTNSKKLTIYLADDHELVAKAIAGLLLSIDIINSAKTFSNGKQLFYFFKDVTIIGIKI